MSPKSITKRWRASAGTNCAIWPEKAKIVPIRRVGEQARARRRAARGLSNRVSETGRALDQRPRPGRRLAASAGPRHAPRRAARPAPRAAPARWAASASSSAKQARWTRASVRQMLAARATSGSCRPGRADNGIRWARKRMSAISRAPARSAGRARLASQSGSCFHSGDPAAGIWGSSGLTSRGAAPSAVRVA